jgi:hypothetical protein
MRRDNLVSVPMERYLCCIEEQETDCCYDGNWDDILDDKEMERREPTIVSGA